MLAGGMRFFHSPFEKQFVLPLMAASHLFSGLSPLTAAPARHISEFFISSNSFLSLSL
jgi:hypothetical protein